MVSEAWNIKLSTQICKIQLIIIVGRVYLIAMELLCIWLLKNCNVNIVMAKNKDMDMLNEISTINNYGL